MQEVSNAKEFSKMYTSENFAENCLKLTPSRMLRIDSFCKVIDIKK